MKVRLKIHVINLFSQKCEWQPINVPYPQKIHKTSGLQLLTLILAQYSYYLWIPDGTILQQSKLDNFLSIQTRAASLQELHSRNLGVDPTVYLPMQKPGLHDQNWGQYSRLNHIHLEGMKSQAQLFMHNTMLSVGALIVS